MDWRLSQLDKEFDNANSRPTDTPEQSLFKAREDESHVTRALAVTKLRYDKETTRQIVNRVNLVDDIENGMQGAMTDLFYDPGKQPRRVFDLQPSTRSRSGARKERPGADDLQPGATQDIFAGEVKSKLTSPLWKPQPMQAEPMQAEPMQADAKSVSRPTTVCTDEWQRLQEARLRKVLQERKAQWLREQQLPDPSKAAKSLMAAAVKSKLQKNAFHLGEIFPASFDAPELLVDPSKLMKIEENVQRSQLISEMLKELQAKKKQIGAPMKMNLSSIGGLSIDRYQLRQQLRAVRLGVVIHQYLETLFTNNTASVLHGALKSVRISVNRVHRKSPTALAKVYYDIISDHTPEFAQQRLELVTPHLRWQLGKSMNLPRVPELRFIHYNPAKENLMDREKLEHAFREVDLATFKPPPAEATRDYLFFAHPKSKGTT